MNEQELAKRYLIYKCRSGSHSYGMATEHSDLDVRGIFIAPPEYTIGCLKNVEQVEVPGEDTVIFELGKFVSLAAQCNPNIIELLFSDEADILHTSPAFEQLKAHRNLFISKAAKFRFSGYAMAQMKRIKGHNRWITNPQPVDPPALLDFVHFLRADNGSIAKSSEAVKEAVRINNCFLVKINESTFRLYSSPCFSKYPVSEDGVNFEYVDISEEKLLELGDSQQTIFWGVIFFHKKEYRQARKDWKEYWKWKKNRNKKRSELEEEHGYDTKHAAHLVRLLRMGHEILKTGEVIVKRPDAQELLDIRNGKFDYKELVAYAEELDKGLDELYETSSLPHSTPLEEINELYIDIVQQYWRENEIQEN